MGRAVEVYICHMGSISVISISRFFSNFLLFTLTSSINTFIPKKFIAGHEPIVKKTNIQLFITQLLTGYFVHH